VALARWQSRLEAIWYGAAPVPWYLAALEQLYRHVLHLRRSLYASGMWRSTRLGVPVLVVGNLSVGGTGKTPLVAALVAELRQRGWQPGIALRGYGGRRRKPGLLPAGADVGEFGDEAVWLSRATGAPVAVGRVRAAAGALLVGQGCNLVVCDDGLQHWALARDLEVLVIDGERRFGNARLLPAGPLREEASRARHVDFIVVNGGTPLADEFPMRLVGSRAVAIGGGPRAINLQSLAGRSVHAVAGIGNPGRFFTMLEGFGITVLAHPLPDHHRYTGGEFEFGDELPVLVTEKDAVKCAAWADARVFVVPVEAELAPAFLDQLHRALHECTGAPP
jgi:tetraacyldisaccharide 4'-kinase